MNFRRAISSWWIAIVRHVTQDSGIWTVTTDWETTQPHTFITQLLFSTLTFLSKHFHSLRYLHSYREDHELILPIGIPRTSNYAFFCLKFLRVAQLERKNMWTPFEKEPLPTNDLLSLFSISYSGQPQVVTTGFLLNWCFRLQDNFVLSTFSLLLDFAPSTFLRISSTLFF